MTYLQQWTDRIAFSAARCTNCPLRSLGHRGLPLVGNAESSYVIFDQITVPVTSSQQEAFVALNAATSITNEWTESYRQISSLSFEEHHSNQFYKLLLEEKYEDVLFSFPIHCDVDDIREGAVKCNFYTRQLLAHRKGMFIVGERARNFLLDHEATSLPEFSVRKNQRIGVVGYIPHWSTLTDEEDPILTQMKETFISFYRAIASEK